MGIFGGKPRVGGFGEVYPAPPVRGGFGEIVPQSAMQAPAQPRRSLFGRVGNWARTRDWERVGAALRDDPSVLSDLMQGRRADQMMAAQLANQQYAQGRDNAADKRQMAEDTRAQQQRARIEAIISSLPKDQQAFALMDPEGYVRGIMRNRFPAPQRAAAGSRTADALPPGFAWDD